MNFYLISGFDALIIRLLHHIIALFWCSPVRFAIFLPFAPVLMTLFLVKIYHHIWYIHAVYLTPDYANRVFKDAYGLSIKDYLTDLRMQKAQLLRDEANAISEVAAQVGFDNFSYFSTQFKKYTGLTPNEWKRQNG